MVDLVLVTLTATVLHTGSGRVSVYYSRESVWDMQAWYMDWSWGDGD